MPEQKDIIAYAEEWVSYLLLKLSAKDFKKIKSIILFGSAARGDFDKSSDVDIFIDLIGESRGMQAKISKASESFLQSKFRERFGLLGIENEIRPVAGALKDWKETKHSILLNGLQLFGKYAPPEKRAALYAAMYWGAVKGNARIRLNSKLFGYTHAGRRYAGIAEKTGGEKLGPRCVMVPLDGYRKIAEVFKEMKIPVKMRSI